MQFSNYHGLKSNYEIISFPGFVDETGTNRNANEKERKILQTALNQIEDSVSLMA